MIGKRIELDDQGKHVYAGPIMDYDPNIGKRHCETGAENHRCPYLEYGCLGCTFKRESFRLSTVTP